MSTTSNFFISLLIIFSIFIFRRYFFLYEVFKVRYFICLMLSHCIIFFKNRQPPILPCRYRHSTFGRIRLYRRVRDVYGCSPYTHRHRLLPLSHLSFPWWLNSKTTPYSILSFRKEVIQPQVLLRLPCYDFTPVTGPAFGSSILSVWPLTSGIPDSHGVTGGVYKTRERIHRSILICDY